MAWLAGIAFQLQWAALPAAAVHVSFAALGVMCVAIGVRWPRLVVVAWIGMAALGLGITGLHAASILADSLPAALEGDDVIVIGVVAGMPQATEGGVRFRFEVEQARRLGLPGKPAVAVRVPSLLALGWYRGFREDEVQAYPPPVDLAAGQRWRFTLRLRRPHGNVNPHGFDYELWLFEQGLRATGYVRGNGSASPQRLGSSHGYYVERLRQHVRDAILVHVADPRAAGVLAALAVGDQAAIGRADWDVFRDTGVAHLMSISGLHVTMFAWLSSGLVGMVWRRSRRLALGLPTPTAARWGGVAASLAYALFSGWGVPAQRTVCMLAVTALLQTSGRRWPWPLVLLTSASVVAALDPWAMLQPGFWLSFMAVGLLMSTASSEMTSRRGPSGSGLSDTAPSVAGSLMPGDATPADQDSRWSTRAFSPLISGCRRSGSWLKTEAMAALRAQFVATIGLTPLTLVIFQQVSVVGFAANLVAIPLVTLIITPLALLGVFVPLLWTVGAAIVQVMSVALGWMAALPWAVWTSAASPVWTQWAGLLGALVLLLPLPWRVRTLSVPLVLPLMLPLADPPPEGSFQVVAADIGQGTAVLVRTRRHLMVYDTGPQYSPDNDAGQRVLVPLLKSRGDTHIDKLVLSHRDTDHVGGAASLLKAIPTGSMLSSLADDHPLMSHEGLAGKPKERCSAGQSWTWDGVRFEVLQPITADYDAKSGGANRLSCVVLVKSESPKSGSGSSKDEMAGSQSLLLTGDIEAAQERHLVEIYGTRLHAQAMTTPHHGSRTSSTQPFVDAVHPDTAIMQAGYLNRFGHPAPDVVARYKAISVDVYGSTDCGAWSWNGSMAQCQRDVDRRYWHWVP